MLRWISILGALLMFDDKCVPEPLGIVLNMFVDPFLSPKSQRTERVQRPDVVDENVRIGSGLLTEKGSAMVKYLGVSSADVFKAKEERRGKEFRSRSTL